MATAVAAESQPQFSELANIETQSSKMAERLEKAELVLSIRVEVALEQLNPALSHQGYLFSEGVKYGVSVTDVWKGQYPQVDAESLVYFEVPLSNCYRTMAKDADYLLLLEASDNGDIRILSCDDILRREQVSEKVAAIYSR